LGSRNRFKEGAKPNQVYVQDGGEVDATYQGKNAWDATIRDFVPKILDMSVVDMLKQHPSTLKKLQLKRH